jgi:GTPase
MNDLELDNGQGRCRDRLIKHYHELRNPKTASINIHYLGFDSQGKIVNREIEQ